MSRPSWIATALLLVATWFVATWVTIGLEIPGPVARPLPYLVAGLVTGALLDAAGRRNDLIAIAVLAIVSAIGWTAFTSVTTTIDPAKTMQLFAVGLPIHALAAGWAYLGLFVAHRVRARRGANEDEDRPDLRALEDEVRRKHGVPRNPSA
jgi:uncharacterized membrane protein